MQYKFTQDKHDRIVVATEFNTRIIWLDDNNKVMPLRTLKSQFKYWVYQRTAGLRHYAGIVKMQRYSY